MLSETKKADFIIEEEISNFLKIESKIVYDSYQKTINLILARENCLSKIMQKGVEIYKYTDSNQLQVELFLQIQDLFMHLRLISILVVESIKEWETEISKIF